MKWNGNSIAGAVLLVVAVVLAFLAAPDDESVSYRLGYALALPFFAMAIVAIGRWVQRRMGGGDDGSEFWSSGSVLALGIVAALIALLSLAGRGEDLESEVADVESRGRDCLADQPLPVSAAPPGLTYGPLTAEDRRLFAAASDAIGFESDLLDGRNVTSGDRFVGAVLLAPGLGTGQDYSDFLDGASAGAADQGLEARSIDVAGEDGIIASNRQITQVATRSGCYAVTVVALDGSDAMNIAGAVASED